MPKRSSAQARQLVLKPGKGGEPATFVDEKTGEVHVLHGYGSMKGKLQLRKAIDLTKPIYEQVLKLDARSKRKALAKQARRRAVVRLLRLVVRVVASRDKG